MEGRGKFDKYTEFWRDVERAREDIYFAQKDRELIAQLREKGQRSSSRPSSICVRCAAQSVAASWRRPSISTSASTAAPAVAGCGSTRAS